MNKRKKYVRRRHEFFAKSARILFGWLLRLILGYRGKRVRLHKQYKPYLFISNHVSAFDPILSTLTMGEQIYYLASEHIFSKGFTSRLLEYTYAPIPKSKSQIDIAAIRQIITVSQEGGNVGIYIEGNSTMTGNVSSVPAAIGKLALLLKRPIVIFNFDVGYLKNPRWSISKRKGTFKGAVKEVLSYEDYKDKDEQVLSDYLINAISVNAYEQNKHQTFPGKNNARGLERLIFTCPACNGVNTLLTKGNNYSCTACLFTMHYDAKGYLHSEKFSAPKTTIALDKENKLRYQELWLKNKEMQVTAHATYSDLSQRRRKKRGVVHVTFNKAGLHFAFTNKQAPIFFRIDEINMIAMAQKENVIVYLNNGATKLLQLSRQTKASAYQFVVTFQIVTNILKYEQAHQKTKRLTPDALGL